MEEKDLFKTETIYDEMIHRECVLCFPHINRVRIWIAIVLEAVLLGTLLQFHDPAAIQGFLLWSIPFLLCDFLMTRKRLNSDYRKFLRNNGGAPWHIIAHIREDGILLADRKTKNEIDVPYDHIRSVIDTPKLLILGTADKKNILMQKCWLMGGTAEALSAFLVEKCARVRKVRGVRFGQWVRRILTGTMIAGSLLGLVLLNWNNAPTGKSYDRIAEDLAPLGITIRPETIAELEAYQAEYADLYAGVSLSAAEQTAELLYMEGMGTFDPETFAWTPSDSGVYWFDMEVLFVDSIYTDFFAGLAAMDADLNFTNVTEDYSAVDLEAGTGTLPVSFDWNGQHHTLEAAYYYDWFDMDILAEVLRIVNAGSGRESLYYAYDGGQGILLYYGTASDVRVLGRMTGLSFTQRSPASLDMIF